MLSYSLIIRSNFSQDFTFFFQISKKLPLQIFLLFLRLLLSQTYFHFRNHTAETLYGWKDYEIIGQRVTKVLIAEENYVSLQNILERVVSGVPWSGKFPFKKKSGEVVMALVTKTPLYEGGELVGVITVSSDAAILKSTNSENQTYKSASNGQPGVRRLNFKRIQWPPRPTIAPMPQIASSVSNLVLISVIFFIILFFFILVYFYHLLNWIIEPYFLYLPGIKASPTAA